MINVFQSHPSAGIVTKWTVTYAHVLTWRACSFLEIVVKFEHCVCAYSHIRMFSEIHFLVMRKEKFIIVVWTLVPWRDIVVNEYAFEMSLNAGSPVNIRASILADQTLRSLIINNMSLTNHCRCAHSNFRISWLNLSLVNGNFWMVPSNAAQ